MSRAGRRTGVGEGPVRDHRSPVGVEPVNLLRGSEDLRGIPRHDRAHRSRRTRDARFQPEAYARWFETPLGRRVWADELEASDRFFPVDLSGRWVLDAGCGDGRFAEHLRDRDGRVTSVDVSAPMRRSAVRCLGAADGAPWRGDGVSLVRADAAVRPIDDRMVDVVGRW